MAAALLMRRGPADFRCRYGAAMNRARTIERQAAGLREDLARLASGEGDRLMVQRAIDGMRYQLELAECLADEFELARAARVVEQ
jgi:hypothetical protein